MTTNFIDEKAIIKEVSEKFSGFSEVFTLILRLYSVLGEIDTCLAENNSTKAIAKTFQGMNEVKRFFKLEDYHQ